MEIVYIDFLEKDSLVVMKIISKDSNNFFESENLEISLSTYREIQWMEKDYVFKIMSNRMSGLNHKKVTVEFIVKNYPSTIELLKTELREEKLKNILGNTKKI